MAGYVASVLFLLVAVLCVGGAFRSSGRVAKVGLIVLAVVALGGAAFALPGGGVFANGN